MGKLDLMGMTGTTYYLYETIISTATIDNGRLESCVD